MLGSVYWFHLKGKSGPVRWRARLREEMKRVSERNKVTKKNKNGDRAPSSRTKKKKSVP